MNEKSTPDLFVGGGAGLLTFEGMDYGEGTPD